MRESSATDTQQHLLLRSLRANVDAAWPYSDQALIALVVVAKARYAHKIWPRVQIGLSALAWGVLGFAFGLILAFVSGMFVTVLKVRVDAWGLLLVVAAASVAGGLRGIRLGRRTVLHEQMSQLLLERNCFECGAQSPASASNPGVPEVCTKCGIVRTPPGPKHPPVAQVERSEGAEAKPGYLGISELRHIDDIEAKAFVAKVRARSWTRPDYWTQWAVALAVIAGVLITIGMLLGSTTKVPESRDYIAAIASVAVGAVVLSLVKYTMGSLLRNEVKSALAPRHNCLECGYPLSGLQVDADGYTRCSECGLLGRPARVTRRPEVDHRSQSQ